MINIKVCKLSDLINKGIILLVSFIFLIYIYTLVIKSIEKFSDEFIKFSIIQNLCISEEEKFVNKMISLNIPANIFKLEDDIEKEFNMADNSIKSKKINENAETNYLSNNTRTNNEEDLHKYNSYINRINGNKIINFSVPYLLKCEKLTDTKYKIGEIIINDYTKKKIELGELEKALFTEIRKDMKVLIYHTHTSESYSGITNYSDSYRTEDNTSNVVRVGAALKEYLSTYGIYVRHDTTTHDYPSYNGAYKASLKTVENILQDENYDIIIDIHRDALASNSSYRPTAEINNETVAKLMFVIGTNAAGLKHDNWIENLKFAIAVQQRASEVFPGLFRDLHLSTSRYNQHTSDKTIILEVGATGNTINEACLSMKYFAELISALAH